MSIAPELWLLAFASTALVLAGAFAVAWRRAERERRNARARQEQAQTALDASRRAIEHKQAELERSLARCGELEAARSELDARFERSRAELQQLRDLVKMHVARRREFEEWANPIRAKLGDSVGHTLRELQVQMSRQDLAIRRQERIVADAEARHRAKQDELERMRRELTLKNYHIAALNERFIRVEERMQDLGAQVSALGVSASESHQRRGVPETQSLSPLSPETERFTRDEAGSPDWMQVLDDWHRQLQERLDRMDDLQSQLRTRTSPRGARLGGDAA